MLNKGFIYLLIVLLASSCQFARFTARPGVPVNGYPSEMYGTYMHIDKHDGVKDTHTLRIDANGAETDDPGINSILNTKDSTNSLSHLGDFYYLNVRESDSLGVNWFVYPFEKHGNRIFIYKIAITKKSLKRMKRCGLKPATSGNGVFIMNEEAFKKYCEKFMKRKDAITFVRIQP